MADRMAPLWLLAPLRRARDHMDRHYREDLDLEQLARVAGVSKYHFVRSFAATYGETPIRYLTRRRIERAQDLLRHANLSVTEVCMAVGFTSLGSFSTRFSALVGMGPIRYLTIWRLRTARQQLRETRRTIAQIAHAAGYESDEAFSRAFKREFGLSPARWRDQQREG